MARDDFKLMRTAAAWEGLHWWRSQTSTAKQAVVRLSPSTWRSDEWREDVVGQGAKARVAAAGGSLTAVCKETRVLAVVLAYVQAVRRECWTARSREICFGKAVQRTTKWYLLEARL